jgi:two-component system chemotaxis response regulator CheY
MTKTLLIADDAAIMREIIKDTARANGWTVVAEACNGQQAVDYYAEHKPDVVTMDLVMPEYDGLHGVRGILKADPKARVLVVSAIDQKDVLKEAFRAGATDFIVKPFDRRGLLDALETLVASAQA